jgi:hypothetical protein
MPGEKLNVVEIEKLKLSNDGRGIEFYNDGSNLLKSRIWDGARASGAFSGVSNPANAYDMSIGSRKFLCANSGSNTGASGWLKIHMISSSGYGATGQAFYIPVFNAFDTKSSS